MILKTLVYRDWCSIRLDSDFLDFDAQECLAFRFPGFEAEECPAFLDLDLVLISIPTWGFDFDWD